MVILSVDSSHKGVKSCSIYKLVIIIKNAVF